MSKDFNIFHNLDEMMKCNFLSQIRTMDAANNLNESQTNNDDFDEYDSLLNNNVVKSPTKRPRNPEIPKVVTEKKTKGGKSRNRRSSSSKERSLSPPIPLLENFNSSLVNIPVSGRTRRAKKSLDQTVDYSVDSGNDTTQMPTSSKRGRGRGRGRGNGRGRGRGKGASTSTSASVTTNGHSEDVITDDSSHHSCDSDYRPETENAPSASGNSNASGSIMERFLDMGRQRTGSRLRVMRNRRNCVSEVAARCPTIDTIDLISSPFPRVEGSITLDSDGEEETSSFCAPRKNTTSGKNTSLDISLEDDNPELSVKIIWKGKPEAFKQRKYQKFANIFKLLAEREGTDIENVVLNLNERLIAVDDTPDSIGYKIFHFINGRVLTTSISSPFNSVGVPKKQRNINEISLKIQSDKWKRPLQIKMLKSEKFRILYIKCAEELNVGIDQLKFSFDGENLEMNDTPADLDLEGGEAIDLRLKN